jgi:hypothetical protein
MSSRVIIIVNWTLSPENIITAWIPKDLHISQPYTKIKSCYTGRTTGEIIDNRLEVLYEYKMQVTNLTKIKDDDCDNCHNCHNCDVYWQGYYNNHLVAFDFSTRNKNLKYNIQTIQEIDGIVSASSMSKITPIVETDTITTTTTTTTTTTSHRYHKFKLSECIVLCEQCGYTQADLIYDIDGRLPSCVG